MKLTVAFILAACMHVSAGVYSQTRISLNMQSADITKVLSTIEKKSSFRFLYNQSLLASNQKVSIAAVNEEVLSIVKRLFENTSVSFELLDNNLVVLKPVNINSQQATVTGRITNSKGEPLAGVTVGIKGSSGGTTTDASGMYTLTVPDTATLIISYVGYETQEVPVSARTEINVQLNESNTSMDQVVVVGYGTQRKIDVTGSVATIKGEEISKQASINPISGLQGKVAGVHITNMGAPGASPQIRIRGLGTVYGNANPLYVVDGVW